LYNCCPTNNNIPTWFVARIPYLVRNDITNNPIINDDQLSASSSNTSTDSIFIIETDQKQNQNHNTPSWIIRVHDNIVYWFASDFKTQNAMALVYNSYLISTPGSFDCCIPCMVYFDIPIYGTTIIQCIACIQPRRVCLLTRCDGLITSLAQNATPLSHSRSQSQSSSSLTLGVSVLWLNPLRPTANNTKPNNNHHHQEEEEEEKSNTNDNENTAMELLRLHLFQDTAVLTYEPVPTTTRTNHASTLLGWMFQLPPMIHPNIRLGVVYHDPLDIESCILDTDTFIEEIASKLPHTTISATPKTNKLNLLQHIEWSALPQLPSTLQTFPKPCLSNFVPITTRSSSSPSPPPPFIATTVNTRNGSEFPQIPQLSLASYIDQDQASPPSRTQLTLMRLIVLSTRSSEYTRHELFLRHQDLMQSYHHATIGADGSIADALSIARSVTLTTVHEARIIGTYLQSRPSITPNIQDCTSLSSPFNIKFGAQFHHILHGHGVPSSMLSLLLTKNITKSNQKLLVAELVGIATSNALLYENNIKCVEMFRHAQTIDEASMQALFVIGHLFGGIGGCYGVGVKLDRLIGLLRDWYLRFDDGGDYDDGDTKEFIDISAFLRISGIGSRMSIIDMYNIIHAETHHECLQNLSFALHSVLSTRGDGNTYNTPTRRHSVYNLLIEASRVHENRIHPKIILSSSSTPPSNTNANEISSYTMLTNVIENGLNNNILHKSRSSLSRVEWRSSIGGKKRKKKSTTPTPNNPHHTINHHLGESSRSQLYQAWNIYGELLSSTLPPNNHYMDTNKLVPSLSPTRKSRLLNHHHLHKNTTSNHTTPTKPTIEKQWWGSILQVFKSWIINITLHPTTTTEIASYALDNALYTIAEAAVLSKDAEDAGAGFEELTVDIWPLHIGTVNALDPESPLYRVPVTVALQHSLIPSEFALCISSLRVILLSRQQESMDNTIISEFARVVNITQHIISQACLDHSSPKSIIIVVRIALSIASRCVDSLIKNAPKFKLCVSALVNVQEQFCVEAGEALRLMGGSDGDDDDDDYVHGAVVVDDGC